MIQRSKNKTISSLSLKKAIENARHEHCFDTSVAWTYISELEIFENQPKHTVFTVTLVMTSR